MNEFPLPNDKHPDGIVVASVWYRDDDEFQMATILVLRPTSPYFRVGTWDILAQEWNGGYYEDHMNIVPAINGDEHETSPLADPPSPMIGYQGLGGDY